jgi:PII-like signaling protein
MQPSFGKSKILRIYLDENIKAGNELLYRVIIKKWLSIKLKGATVYKGLEGFGSSAHIHDAAILEISENLPVVIETVDTSAQVAKALKSVEALLPAHCLVTLQDIKVVRHHRPKSK